eukprot:m.464368 g.464368  ORF g.464368 m.464368 type:complete len:62 (+) comp21617_c0_seq2:309-494(+)
MKWNHQHHCQMPSSWKILRHFRTDEIKNRSIDNETSHNAHRGMAINYFNVMLFVVRHQNMT